MKALPRSLKIGAHLFQVVVAPTWPGRKDEMGLTDRGTNTIYIEEGLPKTQTIYCFYHELLHALNPELGEEIVASLAEQLAQVHLDNNLLR